MPDPAVILVLRGSTTLDAASTWWQVLGYVMPAGPANVAVVSPSAVIRRVVRSLCWIPDRRQVQAVARFDEAVEWVEQRRQASLLDDVLEGSACMKVHASTSGGLDLGRPRPG